MENDSNQLKVSKLKHKSDFQKLDNHIKEIKSTLSDRDDYWWAFDLKVAKQKKLAVILYHYNQAQSLLNEPLAKDNTEIRLAPLLKQFEIELKLSENKAK